jgi:hypothetical protein
MMKRQGVSFWGNANNLKLIVVNAQLLSVFVATEF